MNETRITWIREKLSIALSPSLLNIQDDSHKHAGHEGAKGGAGHFSLEIASPLFEKKSLIECHRMIYEVLDEAIPAEIHALKIKITRSD
ncbi:MAG: BolA family transcriptional regulator [Gammaproteobacteria bacterium]|nr:BolA family transcriptional regulator [Gammaproteobacteria bacterium]